MPEYDAILDLSAPGAPDGVVADAQERLVSELNEAGPIAAVVTEDKGPGQKGIFELLGKVGVTLLSPDVIKHIAQVIVGFAKRNDGYEISVGDIKISKARASDKDVERINAVLLKILARRRASPEASR